MCLRGVVLAILVIAVLPASSAVADQQTDRPRTSSSERPLARWLDLQTASVLVRYRSIHDDSRTLVSSAVQDSQAVRARFLFDRAGRYSVHAGLFTGSTFNSGWNNTGIGTGDFVGRVFLKQLFVSAMPIDGVELQVGGIGFIRGENTEITSYDNDGYIVGERLSVRRADALYFDEVAFTAAHLGDLTQPSVFRRFDRIGYTNYRQLLLRKKLGPQLAASFDVTSFRGTHTLRTAVSAGTPRARVVDSVRLELYGEVDPATALGYGVTVEKTLANRFAVSGGFSDIDPAFGVLNGDRYTWGKRLYTTMSYSLTRELSLGLFLTHEVANDLPIPVATRFEVVCGWNVLRTLERARWF